MAAPVRNVVVLDRDGTIVEDRHYLSDPAGLKFLPGAEAALRSLASQGYRLVVITNQSGVGRGFFTRTQMDEVNKRFSEMMEAAGARLSGIYSCPHAPEADCDCRKPKAGLLLQAAADLHFDPSAVVVVGDKWSDVAFGQAVGAATILVSTGPPQNEDGQATPDFRVGNLVEAARIIGTLLPLAPTQPMASTIS